MVVQEEVIPPALDELGDDDGELATGVLAHRLLDEVEERLEELAVFRREPPPAVHEGLGEEPIAGDDPTQARGPREAGVCRQRGRSPWRRWDAVGPRFSFATEYAPPPLGYASIVWRYER